MDHSSGLVFRRPQATLTADLWSIFAPPFSDRTGAEQEVPLETGAWVGVKATLDTEQLALTRWDGARRTIWTLSLATQALTQITYDGDAFGPVWAPDGLRVLFTHFPRGPERGTTMWSVPASGQGAREPVFEHPDAYPSGTSADGRVVYYHAPGENGWDTFSVALTDSDPQRRPLLTTPVNEQRPYSRGWNASHER